MGRERSRSRDRGRKRSRSRSRSRERRGWSDPDPAQAAAAAAAAQAAAQAEVHRLLSAQPTGTGLSGLPAIQLPGAPPPISLLPGADTTVVPAALQAGLNSVLQSVLSAAPSGGAPAMSSAQQAAERKKREIYVGNLALGQVTPEVLKELFNAALAGFVDPGQQAVAEVKMDPVAGRFAFVEMASEDVATHALALDRTEVFGKGLKIARPSGYVATEKPTDKMLYAQQLAAKMASSGVTNVLLLEGLVPIADIRDDAERQEIIEMVYEEALRCGKVRGVVVPVPPSDLPENTPCRVYVKFDGSGEASQCKDMMDGRIFDDKKITADYVTEVEYNRSSQGEWFTGHIPDTPLVAATAAAPSALPVSGSLTGLPTIKL